MARESGPGGCSPTHRLKQSVYLTHQSTEPSGLDPVSQHHMPYGSTPPEQMSWRWNLVALHQNSPKRSWAGSIASICAPRAIRSRAWRGRCDQALELRRGQAVHAEREEQLAAVMQVVLDQVP